MPKKTKKEKLLAEHRRKLKLLQQQTKQTILKENKAPQENQPPITKNKIIEDINHPASLSKETSLPAYFFTDLKKSLLLSGIIIALEISLYFVRIIK